MDTHHLNLTDTDLLATFTTKVNNQVPQLMTGKFNDTKYIEPNFEERRIPHYRLMKILHSTKRGSFVADIEWWVGRIRNNGVPQCIWMGSILASAMDLLWKSFRVWRSPPNYAFANYPPTLHEAVRMWMESLLAVKNQYFNELNKLADSCPELIWDHLEPVGGAPATPIPLSNCEPTQIMEEDDIEE